MNNTHTSIIVCSDAFISSTKKYDIKIGAYEKQENRYYDFNFGYTLREELSKKGAIDPIKWDFLTIALGISAADYAVIRDTTFDGWTRRIELTISVVHPDIWAQRLISKLEKCLMILTGDIWELHIIGNGPEQLETSKRRKPFSYEKYDSICLLSGGSDSLVGALDLVSDNRHPLFVSETVRKSKQIRDEILESIYGKDMAREMICLSPNIRSSNKNAVCEMTTRSRSIRFIAYAVAASSLINKPKTTVEIHIPENGFISINPPLTIGRHGSLSTKTTYPPYLDGLQEIFDMLNFNVKIVSDYRFKTKGEMFINCKDQIRLKSLLSKAVSCGKIGRRQRACGKCVPCIVRRAAEYAYTRDINFTNRNTDYPDLNTLLDSSDPKKSSDLCAMVSAIIKLKNSTVLEEYGPQLSFSEGKEKDEYVKMLERGFNEIKTYLEELGIDF